MGDGKRIEKKEISAGTTVKAIITGYISYGILIGFAVFIISIFGIWLVKQFPNANISVLSISLPLLGVVFLNFIVHGICKLSIYDVFSKCKTNPENIEKIHTRLNLFVLSCLIFSVISVVFIMILNFNSEQKTIATSAYQYHSIHSEAFADELTLKMMTDFEEEKHYTIISKVILELGITVICLSIIPYQKKLIERYNEK